MDAQIPPNMAALAQLSGEAGEPDADQASAEGDEGYIAEAKRGLDGIKTALYQNAAVSDQFIQMIRPEKKEDSVTRAAILLVTELDKKLNLDEGVLAPVTAMAAGELMELAEAAHGVTFSEQEQRRIVMAAFEGILHAYQVDPQEAADFVGAVGPEAEQQGIADYQAAMTGGQGEPA